MSRTRLSPRHWQRGFAFAEAMVMIMFVGTLMMPMMGSLTNTAGRTVDMRHQRLAEAHAQSVQAQLLASAPFRDPPPGGTYEFPLDDLSTNTVTVTIRTLKGVSSVSVPPALPATPTFYHYRIDVVRTSDDSAVQSPATMTFLTGLLPAKPVNTKDPPIYVCDKVNSKILIVTIDDSSGVPIGTIIDEIPFIRGANCGALSGDAASVDYAGHCPGEMAVHPSGRWLFGAGSQFAWVIDVDPASPNYKKEIWHRDPEANADGTAVDNLLGLGNSDEGSHLALSPCGKYFHVMTNCSCIYHYKFDTSTDPPSVIFLYKNHDSDGGLWTGVNKGVAYSRTGILAVTRQDSAQHGAGTDNTWVGDPRYVFGGLRPAAANPSRWQKYKVDSGHLDGCAFTLSHDGRYVYRHPDTCDSGWGGYKIDLAFARIGSRLSPSINSDNWTRCSLSADGRIMFAPRYEGTNPSFHWYYTDPPSHLLTLNTVNQAANAKNSGWATTSGCGKYFVLAKPLEVSNNDEIQFVNIASLTSGAAPYNLDPAPVPKLSLGNRDPSGMVSRWVERLIVGASDGTEHKAYVLDMGAQKLYKTIELASEPRLIAADPSGCWAISGPRGVTPTFDSLNNFCLRVIDGVLATSPIGFTAGALTSINGGDRIIITSSYTVQIREPHSGQVLTTPFIQSDLGPLNLAQGFFISAALRPLLTATPTAVLGLTGMYYGDAIHSSQTMARAIDPVIDFTWPGATPPGISAPYSVRWTGVLKTSVTDTYLLRVNSDDGARVWLNGDLIIDDYYPWHGSHNADSTALSLTAGQRYPITIEMYNPWSPANVNLSWKIGAAAWVVIPSANLETTMPEQPAAFALTVPDGAIPHGISYFNGSDTHVFPYVPYAFDFPASPGSQIAVSPDDGVLAVMVPNLGTVGSGRRIDLYDINHDITTAKFGLRKWEFNHSSVVPTFRRGTPTGAPTTIKTTPIKDSTINTGCLGCASTNCANEFWNDALNHTADVAFGNKTWHFFGKVFYKAANIYSIEWRTSVDDGATISVDELTPVSDWNIHPFTSVIGTETFAVPTADASSQREVRLRRFSLECFDGGGCAGMWADYMEVKAGNAWGYGTTPNVGNIYFPNAADTVQKFFHGYNPPKFIRSIPMQFGSFIPLGTVPPSTLASDALIFRMNPNGESVVVLCRVAGFGYIGEFNLYDNSSWSAPLPAGYTAESDVALSPDGERIYVSLPSTNQVVTFENSHYLPTANNHKTIATITLPLKPISLAQGEGRDRIQHGRWWDPGAGGVVGRHGHAQVMYRGKIYFLGGHDSSNAWANVRWYDPVSNSFGSGCAMSGHMYPGAVVFDNKIWVIGGDDQLTSSRGSYNNPGGTNVSIYDPVSNTITAGPALDTERNSPAVCTDGDAIYAFGGRGSASFLNTLSMYVAGRWVPVPLSGTAFTNARGSSFMCYYRGFLYIFGGCTSSASYADCKRINLQTLAWDGLAIPSVPGGTNRYSIAGELIGSRVYIFGGESDDSIVMLDLENISSGWRVLGSLPFTGYGHEACAMGGRIYIYGGTSVSVPTTCRAANLLQVFTP